MVSPSLIIGFGLIKFFARIDLRRLNDMVIDGEVALVIMGCSGAVEVIVGYYKCG